MKVLFSFLGLLLAVPSGIVAASEEQSVQASAEASIRVVSSVSYDLESDFEGHPKLKEFYTRTQQSVTISGEKEQVNTSSDEHGVVELQGRSETVEIIF